MNQVLYIAPSGRTGFSIVSGDTWPLNDVFRRTPGLIWDSLHMGFTGRSDALASLLNEAHQRGYTIHGTVGTPPQPTASVIVDGMHKDQTASVGWVMQTASQGCVLGHPMGSGKSWIALEAAKSILSPKLIVCPAFLRSNWEMEIAKRDPPSVDNQWSVVSYNYVTDHINEIGPINAIIFDEGHYLKNNRSQRYKACRKLRDKTPWCTVMTGTPIYNRIIDLWALLDVARPGAWGNFWQFVNAYHIRDPFGNFNGPYPEDPDFPRIVDEIRNRLQWMYYRQDDLANKLCKTGSVRTIPQWIDRPEEYRDPIVLDAFSLSSALKTISLFKTETACALANDLREQGEKTLIFTFLRDQAKAIANRMGWPVAEGGSVDAAAISAEMEQAGGGVATMDSFGMGVNCPWADKVIFAGLDWVHSKMLQAMMRAQRPGRRMPLVVIILVCRGTIEERIADTLISKLNQTNAIVDDSAARAMLEGMSIKRTDEQILAELLTKLQGD